MKKKTIASATALGVLVASVPVHAMPIEDVRQLVNPESTADEAYNPSEVYTSFTGGNSNNSGNGSIDNPYNRFEDAVANVEEGGTIYIKTDGQGAFLNDVGGNKPFLIDKNITIKPVEGEGNAELSVRSAGIILGADVKFENITLDFSNKHHDAIFANGYTLELINVSRYDGAREIDLFAGGLYELDGTQVHPSGSNGVITIETNGSFGGGELMSDFGNIYAGSMNGAFNGDAEINLSRKDNSKKLEVGEIKASGALEADAGSMLDTTEPLPPSANPELFPMSGNVTINLDNYQVSVDGKTGTDSKTSVTTSAKYPTNLPLKNVEHLTVESGNIKAIYESEEDIITIPTVTLGDGATLDLSGVEKEVTINTYNGNGIVVLRRDGKLNITNQMNNSIELQTEGAFGGNSGLVTEDHVYLTTSNLNANVIFNPHATQSYLELVGSEVNGLVEWKAVEAEEENSIKINDLTIEDADATKVKEYDDSNEAVKFPFKALTNAGDDDWVYLDKFDFDITVNGKSAILREDEDGIGTHYFVEDLELAIYFTSETFFEDHELVVMGYTEDFNETPIKVGEYEIEVSHTKEDGNKVGFTSNLTVTGNDGTLPPEEDEEESTADKQIYLSDLGYVKGQSNAWGGNIKVNQNHNGKTIALIVDGERTEFEKGMAAHAQSNLVFDISECSSEYTRLVSYMGIDASQGGSGDGVKFVIYTSNDGKAWKEVETTGVVKGNNEAIYVDLKLNGAKFIKLHANKNGGDGNDHAVYGDLKLVTDDYSLSTGVINGLKTVAEYDTILSGNTIEENMESHKMTIMQRELVNRVGYESLQRLAGKSEKYNEAINYLMNDETALEYFITGGTINKGGSHQGTIRHFCEIYSAYENELKEAEDDNFNLRLAVSISLAYSRDEMTGFWILSNKDKSVVTRYEKIKELVESGNMDEGAVQGTHTQWSTQEFKNLPIPLMRWVVDARLNNDEIMWLSEYALSEKAKGKNHVDAYNYIEYTMGYNYDNPRLFDEENKLSFNSEYNNFLGYYNDYGQRDIYRLWMIFEEGSVCGGLAQTYSVLAEVLGRPSSPSGQPGHAASLTWQWNKSNGRYEWVIQNNISGWVHTNNQYEDRLLGWGNQSWTHWNGGGVYTVLATDAIYDENYTEFTLLNLLANSYEGEDKKEVYENILELYPKHINAMEGLINSYLNDDSKTSTDYFNLAKQIVDTYTYYPRVMMEALALIESKISANEIAQLDLMKHSALLKASNATPEVSPNVGMSKQTANEYLGGDQASELATFSFDGESANKIMINSKYEDSDIRVKYSLDGGNEWIESDDHAILLSEEQLASITADNNIIVGLVGATDDFNYTIDIQAGETPNLYKNDDENILFGNTENLQFSLDGGLTWCDYVTGNEESINPNNVTGMRFEGTQTLQVRYKAHGTRLEGGRNIYTFYPNTDTPERKYVQLKNVNVTQASAHQGGSEPSKIIDGNINSGYHTRHGQTTNDKHMIVEFDQPRYITSMEYVFTGGNNGRLKAGEIQASLDGETWTTIKTFSDLPRGVEVTTFDMDVVVKAQYIKIVANETHGNQSGEANMYLAGKELKFYEDTTIVEEEPEQPIEEVTPDSEGWLKTSTLGQLDYLWNYDINEETKTVTLNSFKGINAKLTDVKVEIPREVEGYKVALVNLNNEVFNGVTHIRVAEGEELIKVLATKLVNGFIDNSDLKHVDFEGLDVSGVTSMSGLFQNCVNLRVVELLDWDIQNDTLTTGIFYMSESATDEQKKLLVITDSDKFRSYDFEMLDNRIPSMFTFNANEGYFFEAGGDKVINMIVPNYTIDTDSLEELDGLFDYYLKQINNPIREGYKFKGWFTEDAEPTNVYELLNMTYKAEWEKVEEDDIPEGDQPEEEPSLPEVPELPPSNDSSGEVEPQPPVDNPEYDEEEPNTPPSEDNVQQPEPPVEDDNVGSVTPPPTITPQPQPMPTPPANGGGTVEPPTTEEDNDTTVENGVENLKDLDKELQEKVDSIIAETVVESHELTLNIVGDSEDIRHVDSVEVTKDGIFAIVDGKKLKFGVKIDGLKLDLDNARVVRINKSKKSNAGYSTMPYQNTKDGLKISSNNLEDILITSKVSEPFVDVSDKDWFKADVEDAYNYVLTSGTTATTYSPYKNITRGEFVVMLARAIELQPSNNESNLKGVDGKWYEEQAQALYELGIIKGNADGTFGGENKITRQEAATFITRMLEYMGVDVTTENTVQFIDKDKIGGFAIDSVQFLATKGVLVGGGDNKFNPTNNLTRAEMAKILVQSLRLTDLY